MNDDLASIATVLTERYRIVRELGAGGMATVYLADDTKHHRQVAVKVLRPELAESVGVERFAREIEIAAGLHHPHILPLYDSGGAGSVLFYVMPFVEGASLRDKLAKGGALPIDEAVRIIREVADALEYARTRGVVHRDIKPENILIAGAHALVMDFGVAKALSDAAGATSLTGTGIAIGTPAYMAPEQAMADPAIDHRADVYALGAMAYELLAGRGVFLGANAQQILAGHLTRAPEPLHLHRSSVSPALEAVVMRCLEKMPADRFQTAGEVMVALDAAVATTSGATASPSIVSGSEASASPETGSGASPRPVTHDGATGATRLEVDGVPPSRPARAGRVKWAIVATTAAVVTIASLSWYSKVGRAGTLIGNDILDENDVVLVSDFQNRTTDSSLATTITDAVRVDLQQSHAVKVMSSSAMASALRRMNLPVGEPISEAKVRELAEREGVKAFVVGDIAKIGGGYQLTARVVATSTGSDALTARATAADDARLLGALEELGKALRRGIGESLRSVAAAEPLARVTTASLPALRAYSSAQRAESNGDRKRAVAMAKEALALDSTFASAWSLLFVSYTNMGQVQLGEDASAHAYAMRARLPEFERLRAEAHYHGMRAEFTEEEAAWARLAESGRDETNYADLLLRLNRLPEAEAMGRRSIAKPPWSSISYWNLAEAQAAQEKFSALDTTSALIAARMPGNAYARFIPVHGLLVRHLYDSAEAFLRAPAQQGLPSAKLLLCTVDRVRGRVRASQACAEPNPLAGISEFRLTGDSVRIKRAYSAFVAMPAAERPSDEYAINIVALCDLGRLRDARALLDEWRTRSKGTGPAFLADSAWAAGCIASGEQRWADAAQAFLAWGKAPLFSAFHFYNRGLPEAALAMERLGKPDSAIALLERAQHLPSLALGVAYDATWYPEALMRLGSLYEARGDRVKAGDYYAKYVELMKDADPELQNSVKAARAKVEQMRSEPRAGARP